MKELKVYISNTDPNLLKSIGGRPGELIRLIRSNEYISEPALENQLFEGKWKHQNFLNLKTQTKRILSAYFLISSPKKNSETLKKMKLCRRHFFTAKHFIELSNRKEAKKLLQKAFKIASAYSFTDLAHGCIMELMNDAALEGKTKKFNEYEKIESQLHDDLLAERLVRRVYYKATLFMNFKRKVQDCISKELVHQLRQSPCSSVLFLQLSHVIRIIYHINETNYHAVTEVADMAFQKLVNRKGSYDSHLHFFLKVRAVAHIALSQHSEAKQLLLNAEQYSPARSYNMAILRYYQAINCLHSGDYAGAYQLYRQQRHTRFEVLRRQWLVMSPYLYFLKQVNRLQTGQDRFSLGKYLNETTSMAHDKSGENINILIGELLVQMLRDRGKFIDRMEAVQMYSYRYLQGPETRRAKWFLRILCMLPRADFQPNAIRQIAKPQIDLLKQQPISMGNNLSVELIPFMDLLEMLMGQLQVRIA